MTRQRRMVPQDRRTPQQEEIVRENNDGNPVDAAVQRLENILGESMHEGDVFVISGANSQPFPVASNTVGEVRRRYRHILNIGPDAAALVNGAPVDADHVLMESDTLEFVKEGGEKGRTRHGAQYLPH